MMARRLQPYLVVAITLVLSYLLTLIIRDSLIDIARVTNESMLPHLKPGQRLLISRLSPCLHLPFSGRSIACSPCTPGHTYVFRSPHRKEQRLVKFAVSKEEFEKGTARTATGDIISFTPRKLPSSFPTENQVEQRLVCYFVGSNGERSVDSRDFGSVPATAVEGRVVYP